MNLRDWGASAKGARPDTDDKIRTAMAALLAVATCLALALAGISAPHLTRPQGMPQGPDTLVEVLARTANTTPKPALAAASAGTLQARARALVSHDADVAWLGAHATSYKSVAGLDETSSMRTLALATREPLSDGFLRHLSGSIPTSEPFSGSIAPGQVPALYQWDERWGYTDYCGMPLGFSGCGPTVMSMAYMGLTGRTDLSPADMAGVATEVHEVFGGTNSTFFTSPAMTARLGIAGSRLADSPAALVQALQAGELVAVSVRPNTLAAHDHWVLAVGLDQGGAVRINDPNSPEHSDEAWSAEQLVDYANALIALRTA